MAKTPEQPPVRSKAVKIEPDSSWQMWANFVILPLIVAVTVFLVVRFRNSSAVAAREAETMNLTIARSRLDSLRQINISQMAPSSFAVYRDSVASQVEEQLSTLLSTTKDPTVRAESLLIQGDLYWQLANFPPLPGASTQPSLAGPQTSSEYLTKAKTAYTQVVTDYADQPAAIFNAKLALGAVAENQADWDEANKLFQSVIDDAAAPASCVAIGHQQLELIKSIREPLYLAPATQPAIAMATTMPAMAATSQPMMSPATQPTMR